MKVTNITGEGVMHELCTGEMRNTYKYLREISRTDAQTEGGGTERRIILKRILRKIDVKLLSGWTCVRISSVVRLLRTNNETLRYENG